MTIKQAQLSISKKLKDAGIANPNLEADVLLAFILSQSKEYLYSNSEKALNQSQVKKISYLIKKRARNYPLAYLTHEKYFYKLKFYVDKNVLIPRPESEMLLEQALAEINRIKTGKKINIIDVGTGSGCLIISLAKNIDFQNHDFRLIATDCSKQALKTAKRNTRHHQVKSLIRLVKTDLLKNIRIPKADLTVIIANLPYLTEQELSDSPSIKFEPRQALVSGQDGLNDIKKLLLQIKKRKLKNSVMLLEIGFEQASSIKNFINKINLRTKKKIPVIRDLCGRDRVIRIQTNY